MGPLMHQPFWVTDHVQGALVCNVQHSWVDQSFIKWKVRLESTDSQQRA